MSMPLSTAELYQLKHILRVEGITQETIAREIGVNQGQLSRILRGQVSKRSEGLRILTEKYAHKIREDTATDKCREEIIEAALALWDGHPASAKQLVLFLKSVQHLKAG